ncbi:MULTISPECIES: hypothetical protein [unclassified Thalassolituus]|uniref:hypothetical protein n=1 Tax=unclassified Thalassolituus TaxID=2624967 RepID=UPI0025FFC5ED|nr:MULTISPECIES: hypothetical protein [unclassified Thalassolituus]
MCQILFWFFANGFLPRVFQGQLTGHLRRRIAVALSVKVPVTFQRFCGAENRVKNSRLVECTLLMIEETSLMKLRPFNGLKIAAMLSGVLLIAYPAMADKDKHDHKGGDLPPGLEKKVHNGGSLPPGWQKRVHVGQRLDRDIYDHHEIVVPVDENGLLTVRIGGKLIRLIEATREVVEVL